MRILFLGTPEFAVPSLETLIAWEDVSVVGLVTQPDRPAGRGKNIFPPPTKLLAERHGIPVLQPEKLSKAPEIVQAMQDLKPDILVTVAFGQILKKNVLTMARFGVMNVHASLLPKYRGAAPINWAIINGEKISGITTMYSDVGVDTGMMLLKREVAIDDDMDAESLAQAMSLVGADLLKETLKRLMDGNLLPEAQNNDEATFAPRLTKELGNIDWNKSARDIHNQVRGLAHWPGTYSHLESEPGRSALAGSGPRGSEPAGAEPAGSEPGSTLRPLPVASCDGSPAVLTGVPPAPKPADTQQVKIVTTMPGAVRPDKADPGTIIKCTGQFLVACGTDGTDTLEVIDVKPANKGKMNATSWANGLRLKPGHKLS